MSRSSCAPLSSHRGFALLEAMLAVAIFALAVLGLGRCISQGLSVEHLKDEDTRANRILQNRAAEIEAGAMPSTEAQIKIDGVNGGMTLVQTRKEVHKKDEHDAELSNIFLVTLEARWTSGTEKESRSLSFYVVSQQP